MPLYECETTNSHLLFHSFIYLFIDITRSNHANKIAAIIFMFVSFCFSFIFFFIVGGGEKQILNIELNVLFRIIIKQFLIGK